MHRPLPITARQLRLASGLVLLSYLTMHLCTHMSGLVSLTLAESGLRLSMRVWQSAIGTLALYGAFGVHIALALRTIQQRRHWQLPAIEWLRLWAGFSLPLLLIGHVVATRVAVSFYGFEPSYTKVVTHLTAGGSQGWQVALLAPGWVHGCLGVWLSLRHLRAAQRLRPLLVAILVGVPLLSAAGYLQMSRSVSEQGLANAVAANTMRAPLQADWRHALVGGYLLLLAGAVVAGRWRGGGRRD